jgi:aromatic O-demethylase, reductase subunit
MQGGRCSAISHAIRIGNDAEPVRCAPGQGILDAFLRAGRWLPNSCNQGTCGTCKVRLCSGEVDHRESPTSTLPFDERHRGWLLACQATPRTDIVLEPLAGSALGCTTAPLRDLLAAVESVQDVARDTRRLVLTLAEPFAFRAGQHVELTVPGTEHSRRYSMANAPADNLRLELQVRREPGGVASDKWVFGRAEPGQEVAARGPLGDFWWEDDTDEPVVMLAGGTGLAPMLSMLRHALPRQPGREITLFHGVRTRAHLYDQDFLNQLHADHPSFRWVACADDCGTSAVERFLTDIASCRHHRGYLCGPPGMVDAGAAAFKRRRMAPRRTHRERFLPAATSSTTSAVHLKNPGGG